MSKKPKKEDKKSENALLKEVITQKEQEIQAEKDKLLRALADLDNYKKRIAMEREEMVKFSNESLITAIIPALDGLQRASEATKKTEGTDEILKGIALIQKQLEDALDKFGVKRVETTGKTYDPHGMEAIMQKESDGPENMVLEEMQKGYTLHGRLIRPAMVIVSKGGK